MQTGWYWLLGPVRVPGDSVGGEDVGISVMMVSLRTRTVRTGQGIINEGPPEDCRDSSTETEGEERMRISCRMLLCIY